MNERLLTHAEPDVQEYGFGGTNNQSSRFKGQVLSEPTLNITPLYIRQNDYLFGAGVADDSKAAWTWSGQVFDKNHVTKEGRCQQSHEVCMLAELAKSESLISSYRRISGVSLMSS